MAEQRLFISHAGEDAAAASRIVAYLEARGASCWVAPRDIPLKSVYAEEITRALQECKACAVIVSRAANSSEAVKRELELASHYRKPFIPIRIDATEPGPGLDYYLRNTQWLDLRKNQNEALDRLVAHVTDAASAPPPQSAEPEFPSRPPMKHALAITLGAVALVAAITAALLWPRARTEEEAAAPASYYAETHVVGDYNWDGVPCGQGPSATVEDGALVFRMEGADAFVHQILSATPDVTNANPVFQTQVSAPQAHAGEMWDLRVQDASIDTPATLTVISPANPGGDVWTRCEATTERAPAPAVAIDGAGVWIWNGDPANRTTLRPDGTLAGSDGTTGTWRLVGTTLTLTYEGVVQYTGDISGGAATMQGMRFETGCYCNPDWGSGVIRRAE